MAVPADDSISGAAVPPSEELSTAPAALERGAPVSDSDKKSRLLRKGCASLVTTLRREDVVTQTCELNQSLTSSLQPQVSLASVNFDQL